MTVVIISAESYCNREKIAERTARDLGYACLGREALMEEASRQYHVPAQKLKEALKDPSSLLTKLSSTRTRALAYYQAALLSVLNKGSVVYHGEAGHMFVNEVSHVLKVRLTADLERRVEWKAARKKIPGKKARELLLKEDEQRQKWFQSVFGMNGMEPERFDLVINVAEIPPEKAAVTIVDTAKEVQFQPITYSVKAMQDQELASRVRAALIDAYPDVTVTARNGDISIKTKGLKKKEKITLLRDQVQKMEGVSHVELGP